MIKKLLVLLLILLCACNSIAQEQLKPCLNDNAKLVKNPELLNNKCSLLMEESKATIYLVTVHATGGQPVNNYAMQLERENKGIVIVWSADLRKGLALYPEFNRSSSIRSAAELLFEQGYADEAFLLLLQDIQPDTKQDLSLNILKIAVFTVGLIFILIIILLSYFLLHSSKENDYRSAGYIGRKIPEIKVKE
jgi:hypothetical protein